MPFLLQNSNANMSLKWMPTLISPLYDNHWTLCITLCSLAEMHKTWAQSIVPMACAWKPSGCTRMHHFFSLVSHRISVQNFRDYNKCLYPSETNKSPPSPFRNIMVTSCSLKIFLETCSFCCHFILRSPLTGGILCFFIVALKLDRRQKR